jgi:hypothetical protein
MYKRIFWDVPQRLPRFHSRTLQRLEDEAKLRKILDEVGELDEEQQAAVRLYRRSADGHEPARLRGLPAIGRNVSGATQHTDPVRALLAKEGRRR